MEQITLSGYLRQAINEYLKKKSHSLITLSDKSGIHYNTLARILKGRVEQPSMETTLGILKICESRQKIGGTLARFFPDYSVILEQDPQPDPMLPVLSHRSNNLFVDPMNTRIIHKIAAQNGAYLNELKKEFGEAGLRSVHQLMAAQVINARDDRLEINFTVLERLEGQGALELLIQSIKLMQEHRGQPLIRQEVKGVSESGMDLISQLIEEARTKIRKVLEDDDFAGNHTLYLAYVCGTIDDSICQSSSQWLM